MTIRKSLYPITLEFLKENSPLVYKLFRKYSLHKGAFVGVCEIEGSFLCDEPKKLYNSLTVGEKLSVKLNENDRLSVYRLDGTEIGLLPFLDSVIPKMLISRGIGVFCYFEAKDFEDEILRIAVSIYCDKY